MLHFDPPWLAAVLERSPHLFVGQWPVPDWARLLWGLCVAWLAAAAAIGLAGIASSWIAVDLLESAFVAGLQLWRAHWLVHFFAIVLVPVAVAGLWRSGYGRNGQHIARLLDAEGVRYVALDLDSERVREAALAGDTVVFADSARREALIAAGILRAAAVVITFAESAQAVRAHTHIQSLNPSVPVIVRARDDADVARLTAAGASEIVPEALESGLMLASHTLVWSACRSTASCGACVRCVTSSMDCCRACSMGQVMRPTLSKPRNSDYTRSRSPGARTPSASR